MRYIQLQPPDLKSWTVHTVWGDTLLVGYITLGKPSVSGDTNEETFRLRPGSGGFVCKLRTFIKCKWNNSNETPIDNLADSLHISRITFRTWSFWRVVTMEWLRLALSKGPNWVGVFFPPFTLGRKQIQFPKRRVPSNIGRWIKSRNPEIPFVLVSYLPRFLSYYFSVLFVADGCVEADE
jgi:hypothetical protein